MRCTGEAKIKPTVRSRPARAAEIIGWREYVALPELQLARLPAKIDTGARTSALHAVDQVVVEVDGARWVEFSVPGQGRKRSQRVRAPLVDERPIKNTSGIPETRLVVRTTLLLGHHCWQIEVSLANREKMEFDLILGRTAIRKRRMLVDPGHSFLLGSPQIRAGTDAATSAMPRLVNTKKGRDA